MKPNEYIEIEPDLLNKIKIVCKIGGLPFERLFAEKDGKYKATNRRYRDINNVKFPIMRALRKNGWTYQRIGTLFNKDHTSVMHGITVLKGYVYTEPSLKKFAKLVDDIMLSTSIVTIKDNTVTIKFAKAVKIM